MHVAVAVLALVATVTLVAGLARRRNLSAPAVARRIGLPRRVVTILEGESLLNDAMALVGGPPSRGSREPCRWAASVSTSCGRLSVEQSSGWPCHS